MSGNLYFMLTVAERAKLADFIELYRDNGAQVNIVALGHGTAGRRLLHSLGLSGAERAVTFSIVTDETWRMIKRGLERKIHIDIPGTGIAMTVPMGSIGGRRELAFLTDGQNYSRGDESSLKNTEYELIMIICNQGYSETVMDAARGAGAGGGTVIHSRGTGMEKAEQFLGISLSSEKDVILICSRASKKKEIMQAVMRKAGVGTEAAAIAFSLPVTDTAGLHFYDDEDDPAGTVNNPGQTSAEAPSGNASDNNVSIAQNMEQ